MDICGKCGCVLTDENWSPSYRKKHSYVCRKCHNKYNRENWAKNRDYYNKKFRNRLRELKWKLKKRLGGKCEVCGIKDLIVLQIHHKIKRLRNEQPTAYLNNNYPLENLRLICANCHMIEHFELAQQTEYLNNNNNITIRKRKNNNG